MIAPIESTSEAWGYGLPCGAAEGCILPPAASPRADLTPIEEGRAGLTAVSQHLPSQRRNAESFLSHKAACRAESYRTRQAEHCPPRMRGGSAQSGAFMSRVSDVRYPLALGGLDDADAAGLKQA